MSLSACLSSPRCRLPRPNFAPTHPDTGAPHSRARETHTCELRIHRKKEIKIENAGPTDTTRRASNLCYTFLNLSVCGCLCVCVGMCACVFSVCVAASVFGIAFCATILPGVRSFLLINIFWLLPIGPVFSSTVFSYLHLLPFSCRNHYVQTAVGVSVCVRESGQLPNLIIIKKDELISLKKEICLFVSVCAPLSLCVCFRIFV